MMMDSMGSGFLGLLAPSGHHVSVRHSLLSREWRYFFAAPRRAADQALGTRADLLFPWGAGKSIPYFPLYIPPASG